jgi:hypothetical protein
MAGPEIDKSGLRRTTTVPGAKISAGLNLVNKTPGVGSLE